MAWCPRHVRVVAWCPRHARTWRGRDVRAWQRKYGTNARLRGIASRVCLKKTELMLAWRANAWSVLEAAYRRTMAQSRWCRDMRRKFSCCYCTVLLPGTHACKGELTCSSLSADWTRCCVTCTYRNICTRLSPVTPQWPGLVVSLQHTSSIS